MTSLIFSVSLLDFCKVECTCQNESLQSVFNLDHSQLLKLGRTTSSREQYHSLQVEKTSFNILGFLPEPKLSVSVLASRIEFHLNNTLHKITDLVWRVQNHCLLLKDCLSFQSTWGNQRSSFELLQYLVYIELWNDVFQNS